MIETDGLNLQNPFRLRLLSHMKCFSEQITSLKQIDMTNKSDNVENSWLKFQLNLQAIRNCFRI